MPYKRCFTFCVIIGCAEHWIVYTMAVGLAYLAIQVKK